VWLAQRWGFTPLYVVLSMTAVFGGHLYPVYYGFKGGKGVATAAGVLLALSPWLGLSVLATWLLTFALSRISSLSALVAAGCAPLFALVFLGFGLISATVLVLAAVLIWRHKSNIRNLLDGTEQAFGKS
jgi:glycerol-3-phosphate acyltransferase PlsY